MSDVTLPSMQKRTWRLAGVAALLASVLGACTPAAPTPAPRPTQRPPAPTPAPAPSERAATPRSAAPLPPIPLIEGQLAPRVVYPEANAVIPVRDSNFIFGSVGNGHATLTINGAPVPVAPNG